MRIINPAMSDILDMRDVRETTNGLIDVER